MLREYSHNNTLIHRIALSHTCLVARLFVLMSMIATVVGATADCTDTWDSWMHSAPIAANIVRESNECRAAESWPARTHPHSGLLPETDHHDDEAQDYFYLNYPNHY